MKKIYFILLLAVTLFSCTKDEPLIPNTNIVIEGITSTGNLSLRQDGSLLLKAAVDNTTNFSVTWSVNGKEVSTEKEYTFVAGEPGEYRIVLKVVNHDGGQSQASITIDVYGIYKHGTFVLNEGNMTSENGSLIFISPEGIVTDSAYWRVNNSFLGNSTQDLYIAGNKIYILSQNGGGDGTLVVANAETLEKAAGYSSELSALSQATHVAVVGDNAYIRDNNGVQLFNLKSKTLTLIEGSQGAAKNRMAVVGEKVFVPAGEKVFVIKGNGVIHTIEMDGSVSGVIKTADNNLYVSCTTSPAQINKISASDYSVLQSNEITVAQVGAGYGSTPGISAKGDTIYFSNATTKIYRHIFSKKQTDYMTDVKDHIQNAGIVYNNLGVHPATGEVYFNTIKGYGLDFLINDISVFNFSGATPVLKADYKDHTHFPSGIFFTGNF